MSLCFGIGAIWWSITTYSDFTAAVDLDLLSGRILQTEPIRLSLLKKLADEASKKSQTDWARPETLREIAIINERLLEQELLEGKRTAIDQQIEASTTATERALRAAPIDSFLWMTLYWLRTAQAGFSPDNLPLLKMSYDTGPNEGWVATRRNRMAFIAFDYLPDDLRERAFTEFVSLVRSGYIDQTAEILVGPAWRHRDVIMARIENLEIGVKQRLARRLYDFGYDLDVPGVARFGERPWK